MVVYLESTGSVARFMSIVGDSSLSEFFAYCFSFELPFSFMFSSNTRKERETQLAEHISRRYPLRLSYHVSARLSLFTKNSNRGFSFHRCGELFLLYVTSQTTKSQMVPYHVLYPIRGRREVVATVVV